MENVKYYYYEYCNKIVKSNNSNNLEKHKLDKYLYFSINSINVLNITKTYENRISKYVL